MPCKSLHRLLVPLFFSAAMAAGCGDLFEGGSSPAMAASASGTDKSASIGDRVTADADESALAIGVAAAATAGAGTGTVGGGSTPEVDPPKQGLTPAPKAIRLAINGDSIANGADPSGTVNEAAYVSFRGPLYRAIAQRGFVVESIGTRSTPVRDDLAPPLHSAQGGARIDTAQGGIPSISQLMDDLKAAYPNGPYDDLVYVIEGGTNNALVDTPAAVAAKWDALIRKQRQLFPGSWLVLVGMVPASWINASYFSAVNAVLADADQGGRVIDARLGDAGLNGSDYVDGTHLSKAGSLKAGAWIANRFLSRAE